jgi:hypothetical protein
MQLSPEDKVRIKKAVQEKLIDVNLQAGKNLKVWLEKVFK